MLIPNELLFWYGELGEPILPELPDLLLPLLVGPAALLLPPLLLRLLPPLLLRLPPRLLLALLTLLGSSLPPLVFITKLYSKVNDNSQRKV